jgi:hypothetical protein
MRTCASLLALAAAALLAAPAWAAHGITPLSPASGATVRVGTRPTFRLRVHGPGAVWVRVCRSKRRHRDGTICDGADLGRAHRRRGSLFTYRPPLFRFAGYWLERRGTYYWQAYRLDCGASLRDCRQEGQVIRFRVG